MHFVSSWQPKSSSGTRIFESTSRRAFTRGFARAEVLRSQSLLFNDCRENSPMARLSWQNVRVTQPHALVMLKLLALDDRYRNVRGRAQQEHDREEARTHSADCIAVISGQALRGEPTREVTAPTAPTLRALKRPLTEWAREV